MRRISVFIALLGSPLFACSVSDDASTATLVVYPQNPDGTLRAACDGASPCVVDLGSVPLYTSARARFTITNESTETTVISSAVFSSLTGGDWEIESISAIPAVVEPSALFVLIVLYSPTAEIPAAATVAMQTDAAGMEYFELDVEGHGVFVGAPDIEVSYGGYTGPATGDCVDADSDGEIEVCTIPTANALDFGSVGTGSQATMQLKIRNAATCAPSAGGDPCAICALTVDNDASRQNIGFGFKAGTNAEGLFGFVGSTAGPFTIRQRNLDVACGETGEISVLLTFDSPTQAGTFQTTVVIESNDPDEPLIEVPIVATRFTGPIAIAKFDASTPVESRPLTTVFFDGSDSYDMSDPSNPAAISAWQWEILEYPAGANGNDFAEQGVNTDLFSFWIPLAGHYVVRLTVWNTSGIQSFDTPQARVEFDAVPAAAVVVELTWNNATNDQDLHLVNVDLDDRVCNVASDCHSLAKTPVWFSGSAAGQGSNPYLDIDDTNGLGPENILIDAPAPGIYRIYVHFNGAIGTGGADPTSNTVKVYINGLQVAEFARTLSAENDVWAVADVVWSGSTGFVTPYDSNPTDEVGTVATMPECSDPGWVFP